MVDLTYRCRGLRSCLGVCAVAPLPLPGQPENADLKSGGFVYKKAKPEPHFNTYNKPPCLKNTRSPTSQSFRKRVGSLFHVIQMV